MSAVVAGRGPSYGGVNGDRVCEDRLFRLRRLPSEDRFPKLVRGPSRLSCSWIPPLTVLGRGREATGPAGENGRGETEACPDRGDPAVQSPCMLKYAARPFSVSNGRTYTLCLGVDGIESGFGLSP
jgi:hypothetical protein